MNRLDLFFQQRPTKNNSDPNPVTFNMLAQQSGNFFLIGVDGKNPWQAQSHRLGPTNVLELTRAGVKIRATPHIGLHWPSNSMYPHMGVTICDYMGNMAYVDTADEPQNIKEGGSTHNCAKQGKDEQVLSPYLELNPLSISRNGYNSAKRFSGYNNLASVHHRAKIEALGLKNVMLDSDILIYPWVRDFFQVLIENENWILQGYDQRAGIFDRFININGAVNKVTEPGKTRDIDLFLQMKRNHASMIREDCIIPTTGFFPIKEAVILLDSLACYWEQREEGLHYEEIGDSYTTSGIDMINYTKSQPLRDVLDRMYKALLASNKFEWLPKFMAHTIFPGGTFRFLPCNAEQELLDCVMELFRLNNERKSLDQQIAGSLGGLSETSTPSEIRDADNYRAYLLLKSKEILSPAIVRARRAFRVAISGRRGFSQYDLLNGEYVPQEIIQKLMAMSFEEIQILFKTE